MWTGSDRAARELDTSDERVDNPIGATRERPVPGTAPGTCAAWPLIAWVGTFMLAPLGLMLVYSFWRYSQFTLHADFTLANYRAFLYSPVYPRILLRTVGVAAATTCIALVLAYPVALYLYRQRGRIVRLIMLLIIIPFWVNTLVRNYAFYGIFGRTGLVNTSLGAIGIGPMEMMFTMGAVITVCVYVFLPYAIVALYSGVEKISPSLMEAAQDLGANSWDVFRRIIFPLSRSGLQAAIFFVFIPCLGVFLTPAMIGGGRTTLMANLVVPILSEGLDFARGSAFAMIFLAAVLVFVLIVGRFLDLERLYSGGVGRSLDGRAGM